MSTIFISHSSRDSEHAQMLRDELANNEYDSVFLDFDPMDGIPAGQSWERTLYRKLRACDVVVVLFSENHRSSNWCFAEVALARMEGKHVVTLLVGADTDQDKLPSILTENQFVDLRDDREESFAKLWRGLAGLGVRPEAARAWNPKNPPYPGMLAFDEREASIFFGRENETRKIVEMLNAARRRESDRLLIVMGASGSGKSSIVRAGVVPRLRRDSQWVLVGPFRPGRQPVDELAVGLLKAFDGDTAEADEVAARLRRTSISEVLADARRKSGRPEATPLLIIDQFEELLVNDASAREFLQMVNEACASEDPVIHFMVTLRSDFTAELHRRLDLPALLDAQESYAVGPMQPTAMRRIITEPAKLGALEFEEGLVDLLLDEIGTPDALPLLAFTLRVLWDRGHDDGVLDNREYEEIGGLGGAIAHEADAILGGEFDDELRGAFVRMSRLGENGGYARVTTDWDDHPKSVHPALQRFVDQRILVSGSHDGVPTVEIAHEALLRQWPPLTEALDKDRDSQRTRQDIERVAGDWTAKGRRRDLLYSGATLTVASKWETNNERELDEDGKAFLRASRRRRRFRRIAAIAGIVSVIALLAVVGGSQIAAGVEDAFPELPGRDLSGQDLAGVELGYGDLSDANLSGADLSEALLWDADLTGANLQAANLTDACMKDVNLSGADLTGANMLGADLSSGDNFGVFLFVDNLDDLEASELKDADLTDVDLTDADLTGANLMNVDLTRAVLDGANLSGARLSGAALSDAALVGVVYDDEIAWPDGFTPPPLGRTVPEPACDRR